MPASTAGTPSIGNASKKSMRNILGVKKNILEKGLLVAGFLNNKICVKLHLNPEQNDAVMTRINPKALNVASPDTMRITPIVMKRIIAHNFQVGDSRRKMKAKSNTKAKTLDLHIVKNVNEMKRKLKFPRPMSKAVAVPQGVIRVR